MFCSVCAVQVDRGYLEVSLWNCTILAGPQFGVILPTATGCLAITTTSGIPPGPTWMILLSAGGLPSHQAWVPSVSALLHITLHPNVAASCIQAKGSPEMP